MKNIDITLTDHMVSEDYEIYCVEDIIDEAGTQYHSHDFYEIHITLVGESVFYLDGIYQTLTPGSVLLIHHGDLHRICTQKSSYYERLYMYLTPSYLQKRSTKRTNLEKCFEPVGNTKSKILHVDIVEIINFLKFFSVHQETTNYGDDVIFEQSLINFLLYINKLVMNDEFELIGGKTSTNQLVNNIVTYVTANLSNDLSLDTVADKFYISKYHLSHKFKEITDMTFHSFVTKKRLNYSKQLLRKQKTISEVYSECGFSTYSYFLKSFKKEYGITPKEFVNQLNRTSNIYFQDHSYR